jgi:hypothetical protein
MVTVAAASSAAGPVGPASAPGATSIATKSPVAPANVLARRSESDIDMIAPLLAGRDCKRGTGFDR